MGVWPVKAPDLSWADWRYALEECVAAGGREAAARRLEARWSPAGDALACLSVRSAFDLLLRATGWDAGDEVVFTAVTVPDMPRIARLHGLRPVPLDIDPVSTEPDTDRLSELVGPRTRAVVHAHLFGGRVDLTPLARAAHRHGLLLVEDCAQCYRGPGWTGHEASDVTLFSFGPWKTATALGGAMARVEDAGLRGRMRVLARDDPVQGPGEYLGTVLTSGALKIAGAPPVFEAFVDACRSFGVDHRRLVHRLTKGYRGPGFRQRIRRRPGAALLAVLERRLDEGDGPARRRERPAAILQEALGLTSPRSGAGPRPEGHPARDADPGRSDPAHPEGGTAPPAHAPGGDALIVVPGRELAEHAWWMVPVRVEGEPADFMAALLAAGFDTTRGRLGLVGAGDEEPAPDGVPGASRLLESSVFIPFDPRMPEAELRRLGRAVRRALGLGEAPGRA